MTGGGGGPLEFYHMPRYGDGQWPARRVTHEDLGDRFLDVPGREWFVLGDNVHHYMKVRVTGDRATYTAIQAPDGEVLAEFRATRRGAAPSALSAPPIGSPASGQ